MTTTAIATADEPEPPIIPGQRATIETVAFTHLPLLYIDENAWRRLVSRIRWPRCGAIGCGHRWPCPTYERHRTLGEQLAATTKQQQDEGEGQS